MIRNPPPLSLNRNSSEAPLSHFLSLYFGAGPRRTPPDLPDPLFDVLSEFLPTMVLLANSLAATTLAMTAFRFFSPHNQGDLRRATCTFFILNAFRMNFI